MFRLTTIKSLTISAFFLLSTMTFGVLAAPPTQFGTLSQPDNNAKDAKHKQWIELLSISNATQSRDGKSVLYEQAVATKSKRFNSARNDGKPIEIDPATQRIIADGERLINKIIQTNGKINPQQEKAYDQQMFALIKKMDALRLTYQGGNGLQDGPAGCMLECDGAYPGLGGGNGWNRFWCKSSCLKINVGRAGIGGQ